MAAKYQIINVPGHGPLQFPDDMSDEEIAAAIDTLPAEDVAPAQPTNSDVPVIDRNGRPVLPAATPQERPGVGEALWGGLETVAALGTGAVGSVVGAARGLGSLAADAVHGNFGTNEAAQRASEAAARGAESMTYAPRSRAGQRQLTRLQPALEVATALAPNMAMIPVPRPAPRAALRAVAQDNAEASAGRNAATQSRWLAEQAQKAADAKQQALARLDAKRQARQAPLPEERRQALARGWADRNGVQFDNLHPDIQTELTAAAAHPKGFKGITAEAVTRHDQILKRTGVSPTNAQVNPSVEAVAQEKAAAAIPEASDLRSVRPAQDAAVAANVDRIRASFGVAESGREQLGIVIQNKGLRTLKEISRREASARYGRAADLAPDYEVPIDRIVALKDMDNQPLARNLQFLKTWLNRGGVEETIPAQRPDPFGRRLIGQRPESTPAQVTNRPVTLRELNDLRVKANRQIGRGGPEAFGARQVVQAIDETMAEIAVNESRAGTNTTPAVGDAIQAWQDATRGWREHMQKWNDPQSLRKLTGESRRVFGRSEPESSTNPRVDMERTIDAVTGGGISTEGLRTIYARLNEGTTPLERSVGTYTRNAIRAGVVDHLSTVLRKGAEGTSESARSYNLRGFVDAFDKLEQDGKIAVVFDEAQARELRDLVRDARMLDEAPVGYMPKQPTPQQLAVQIKANTPRVQVEQPGIAPPADAPIDTATSNNLVASAAGHVVTHGLQATGAPYLVRRAAANMLLSRYRAFRERFAAESKAAEKYASDVAKQAAKEAQAARKAALEQERADLIRERTAAAQARRITAARESTLTERARQQRGRDTRAEESAMERMARRETRRDAARLLDESRIRAHQEAAQAGENQLRRALRRAQTRRIPGHAYPAPTAVLRPQQEQNQE